MMRAQRGREPPRVAEWILERCVPRGRTGESVVGDAREEFQAHLESGSRVPPAVWYWLHVLPIAAHGLVFGLGTSPGAIPAALAAAGRDLRVAVRTLRRRPGLTAAVVGTLAIGVGGITAAFGIVNAVLFDSVPYHEPNRLVGVYRFRTDAPGGAPPASMAGQSYSVPPLTFADWQEGGRSFEAMGAFEGVTYALGTPGGPVRISGVHATSGTFRALGVQPLKGRFFLPREDAIGGPRVALVSYGLWERAFASDPDILGRTITLDGVAHAVVGIMPPGFSFPYEGVDVWAPLPDSRRAWPTRSGGFLQVVGRLADEVTMVEAQREMTALQARLAETYEGERSGGVRLYPLRELQVAQSRPGLLLLLGATALVLLIACANVTNLLLVRALERDHELAVRAALGGGRVHLVAQLASEGIVLALLGGGAAILVAAAGLGPLLSALPMALPNAGAVRVDGTVLAFALVVTIAVGVLTGLAMAVRTTRTPVASALREDGRGSVRGRRARFRTTLAVGEMALAFVLLSGAGLSLKGFLETSALDPGFESRDRLAMRILLPEEYRDDGAAVSRFFEELTDRLSSRGDVVAAGSASQMPYSGGTSFPPASVETGEGVVSAAIHNSAVTSGYFDAAGIRLVSGRLLEREDRAGSLPVAVVNETLARTYWPDESALGHRLRLDLPGDSVWRTVVGVVEDVRYGFGWAHFPEFYTTVAQRPLWYQTVLVHVGGDPATVAEGMREALEASDPGIPAAVLTWDELASRSRGFTFARFGSLTMAFMAGLAALLAVVGVYGVIAFTVRMRRHEFGVRVALGGSLPGIVGGVLVKGLRLATAAIAIGLVIVLAAGRFLDPSLFPAGTRDPVTLALVALLLLGTGLGASVLPAFRSIRVDPVTTLRAQ
jgi:putative ABC transport system permease protein